MCTHPHHVHVEITSQYGRLGTRLPALTSLSHPTRTRIFKMSNTTAAHHQSANPSTSITDRAYSLTGRLAADGERYTEWFQEVREIFVRRAGFLLLSFVY